MAGYHLYDIPKGTLGEYSKVIEEFMEFSDSIEQDCSIMAVLELSDLIGSLKHYFYSQQKEVVWTHTISDLLSIQDKPLYVDYQDLKENFKLTLDIHHPNHWSRLCVFLTEIDQFVRYYHLTIRDLIRMSYITERAFLSGQRT